MAMNIRGVIHCLMEDDIRLDISELGRIDGAATAECAKSIIAILSMIYEAFITASVTSCSRWKDHWGSSTQGTERHPQGQVKGAQPRGTTHHIITCDRALITSCLLIDNTVHSTGQ